LFRLGGSAFLRLMQRQQKIALKDMQSSGPTRLIVYCGDYKCTHSVVIDAGRWGDDVRLSNLEPLFTSTARNPAPFAPQGLGSQRTGCNPLQYRVMCVPKT
jgi:hypothetical protein